MSHRPRTLVLCTFVLLLISLSGTVTAQTSPLKSITYRLSMTRPNSHLFEVSIEIEVPGLLEDKPVELQMPKWSPGRYAVFDFAKNVQEFQAVAGISPVGAKCKMSPLSIPCVDDQTWSLATNGGTGLT